MGKCITADCNTCATCVSAVSSFVQSQQQVTKAGDVQANFNAQSSQIAAGLTTDMKSTFDANNIKSTADAIAASPAGNLGKKAGSLCMQMQCEFRRCWVFLAFLIPTAVVLLHPHLVLQQLLT
jgi:hypothetical protein